MLRYDDETRQAVTNLAASHRVWLITGSDDAEPRRNPAKPDDEDDFNAAFLVSPDGEIIERYCKRNLVIFGEYIPLVRWLPFIKWFTPIQDGFTAGGKPGAFVMNRPDGRLVKTSPLICFEDTFPLLARDAATDETDFLVNITNDGWFGEGAAQWQHAAAAAFRAVEEGLPLVRCANTGLTCWIDSHGRVREFFADERGSIYGPGFLSAQIPLRAAGEKRAPTFYHEHGDGFGWSCVALTGLVLLPRLVRFKSRSEAR
jgi:apolipoprotein N-acyltransferase